MFKIKAIVVGFVTQLSIFLLLMAVMASVCVSVGSVSYITYDLFTKIIWVLAVFCGGFMSAKIANEKAIMYASAMMILWVISSLVLVLGFGGGINPLNLSIQIFTAELSAVVGAVMGMIVRKNRY